MKRIDAILQNEKYREHLRENFLAETDRIFCKHDLQHFLDVARIAVLISYENELQIDRELIYAAALLHDIGRHEQYSKGIPHEEAGARIAAEIMEECGFTEEERQAVVEAIADHRGTKDKKSGEDSNSELHNVINNNLDESENDQSKESKMFGVVFEDHVGSEALKWILYRADKASRACFACAAKDLCNWSNEKKNLQIKY